MATKKRARAVVNAPRQNAKPAFPYTTRPAALRRFLTEVPKRPRPPRVNGELLASWELGGGENQTIIRVLKALGLVSSSNEPTDLYTDYMTLGSGPAVMAQQLRSVYAPLFNSSHEPHKQSEEALRNLFNVHSSGAAGTIAFQIQTFKALCDYADFGATRAGSPATSASVQSTVGTSSLGSGDPLLANGPTVHIALHIHLPPDKSARDYEYIIQDIGKYIYGRTSDQRKEQ